MADVFLTFNKKHNEFSVEVVDDNTENVKEILYLGDANSAGDEVYMQLTQEHLIPLIKKLVANL